MNSPPIIVTSTESDNPFAIDIASHLGQTTDISDVVSLKTFANSEFCPRFISDERDVDNIGARLAGMTIVVVSTTSNTLSRNDLSLRTMLLARAAKDNGAGRVVLVEPDLYYSAQDRGPRPEHGEVDFDRGVGDFKKFDGQPFSSRFYAEALALAGVDTVITVHNHSASVRSLFDRIIPGGILNLNPAEVFADYIRRSSVSSGFREGGTLLICAPDKGAREFACSVHQRIGCGATDLLFIAKHRLGERNVSSLVDPESPCPIDRVTGHDVIVFDDMVRTGNTIRECCNMLKKAGARRVVFFVTHFYSSPEVRETLSTGAIDEIVTTNTLPGILNRDMQGRLRRKLTVLKLERWIAWHTMKKLGLDTATPPGQLYTADMSSKNPRWSPDSSHMA
jgi:ribose-phosphate pyrophosphokinase